MKKAKKKKKIVWQQYIGMLFMLLIGACCGYIGLYVGEKAAGQSSKESILVYIVLILSIYPALFFHLIVHEAGHLIFGLLTGYKFSSFRIASFMWLKENGKLKLKRLSLAGTGGQCLMIPPSMKNGKIPVVLYNLGGSLVNVFFSVLFLLLYILCKDIPFLSSILVVFSIMGFGIAIMNGIPMRMGAVDNDGYNAFALLKNKSAIKAFWVQLKVGEQLSKGVRIKEMPQEWFEIPSDEEMKNSMVASRGVFACNRLMDMEKFEEADKLMEHLLEIDSGIIGLYRNLLVCDRIFVELIRENRRDIIENMLTKEQKNFMKSMKNYPSVLRTEYSLALLFEKNNEKAEKIKNEFKKVEKTYPYPCEIESERELMKIAEEKNTTQTL